MSEEEMKKKWSDEGFAWAERIPSIPVVFVRAPTEGAVVESGGISAHGESTSDGHKCAT